MIAFSGIVSKVREVLNAQLDVDPEDGYSDSELTMWAKQAAFEILNLKPWLQVDTDGNPRGSSQIVTNSGADFPEKYEGALIHGTLMFVFGEDMQRSSFERGQFYAQLGVGGRAQR